MLRRSFDNMPALRSTLTGCSGLVCCLLVLAPVSLAGCTNQQAYDAILQNRRSECEKLLETARLRCLERLEDSYGEYARKRRELLDDSTEPSKADETQEP